MNIKPIRADIDKEKHRLFKAKLSSQGMTIAEWIRIKIDEELKEQ